MHNHGGDKRMMWMMVLCCAIPLILVFIFGVGGEASGAPSWVVFGGIAAMAAAHFFMMGKSHKHSDEEQSADGEDKDGKGNKDHSSHGCCR